MLEAVKLKMAWGEIFYKLYEWWLWDGKRCLTHSSGLSRAVIFSCIIGSLLQALLWDIRTHSNMASILSSYLFSLEIDAKNKIMHITFQHARVIHFKRAGQRFVFLVELRSNMSNWERGPHFGLMCFTSDTESYIGWFVVAETNNLYLSLRH